MNPTIGLYLGTGYDGGGVGSLQTEWNLWGKRTDHKVVNFIQSNSYTPNFRNSTGVRERAGDVQVKVDPLQDEPMQFNDPETSEAVDLLVILKSPQPINKDKDADEKQTRMVELALSEFRANGGKTVFLHVDYSKVSVHKRIFSNNAKFFDQIDLFWSNSDKNPIFKYMDTIDSKRGAELREKSYCKSHQIMGADADSYKELWLPMDEKFRNQVYFQSRPVPWKGFGEWFDFKKQVEAASDLRINSTMNGLNPDLALKKVLFGNSTVTKAKRPETPGINYNDSAKAVREFSTEILPDTQVFSYYDKADGLRLMRESGFGGYYTKLETWNNFFPENANIEVFNSGTVSILPSWYFDSSLYPYNTEHDPITIITDEDGNPGKPKDFGMLSWTHDDEASSKKLAKKMKKLMKDDELYESYRERAFNWLYKRYDAEPIVDGMLKQLGF